MTRASHPLDPSEGSGLEGVPPEPTLFPKLRVRFADFPYPHYFYRLEASCPGDRMRLFGTDGDEG